MVSFLSCEWVRRETLEVWSFGLKVLQPDTALKLLPGRFVNVEFPDAQGNGGTRCYSIAAVSGPDAFEISVRRRGSGGVSDSLVERLKPGGLLRLIGIAGDITPGKIAGATTVLMLAAGIGITVPIALLRDIAVKHRAGEVAPKVRLMMVAPALDRVPFLAELLSLHLSADWFDLCIRVTRQKLACVTPCFGVGRPSADDAFEHGHWQSVVICGGHGFAGFFQAEARRLMPDCQLLVEAFSGCDMPLAAPVDVAFVKVVIGAETVMADAGKNLLAALEERGVIIASQCRAGICGRCRIKVVAGDYRCDGSLALSAADIANGYALACCTFATGASIAIEIAQ